MIRTDGANQHPTSDWTYPVKEETGKVKDKVVSLIETAVFLPEKPKRGNTESKSLNSESMQDKKAEIPPVKIPVLSAGKSDELFNEISSEKTTLRHTETDLADAGCKLDKDGKPFQSETPILLPEPSEEPSEI